MKSTMEKLSSNKVRIDFVVEAAKFEEAMQKAYRKNVGKIMDDLEKGWRSPVNNVGFQQLLLDTDEWK